MNKSEIPSRNHWTTIGKEIISSFYQLIVLIFLVPKYGVLYIIGLFGIIIVLAIIKWRKTVFYIKEGMLVSKSGVFTKKEKEIPLDKITTIDIEQRLMGRLFNICTLKIDNGASGVGKEEVKMVVKVNAAETFRRELLGTAEIEARDEEKNDQKNGKKENNKKHITVTPKHLILYSLTKNKIGWLLGIGFVLLGKFDNYLPEDIKKGLENVMVKVVEDMQNKMLSSTSLFLIIFYALVIISIAYVLISIIAIGLDYVRYNKFELVREEKKIDIQYGMFTKKKYTLPIEKIQALKFKQNFIQQLIGLYTIEAIIMGYGDDEKKAILYPIGNEKTKNTIISQLLPEFMFEGKNHKPSPKHILSFIIKRSVITLIIGLPIVYWLNTVNLLWIGVLLLIILLWQMLLGFRHYKNTALGIDRHTIFMSVGSITKVIYIIKKESIQSVTKSQNLFQKPHKISNYKIDLCNNSFGETITVRHLNEDIIKEIESFLL